MKFELNPREATLTCVYCLSALEEGEGWTCDSCGARLHEECTQDLRSCPSVGCSNSPRPPAREESLADSLARRTHQAEARARREAEQESAQRELRERMEASRAAERESPERFQAEELSRVGPSGGVQLHGPSGPLAIALATVPAGWALLRMTTHASTQGRLAYWTESDRIVIPMLVAGVTWAVLTLLLALALSAFFKPRGQQ